MNYRESDLILRLDNKIPSYDVSLNGQTKFYTLCNMLARQCCCPCQQIPVRLS